MPPFKTIETFSLIIFQVLFENILVEVYGVLVNVIFKLYSNSLVGNINLSDDVYVMILVQFEVLSQPFPFYLQVVNMVNVVLLLHTLLAIFPLCSFFLVS